MFSRTYTYRQGISVLLLVCTLGLSACAYYNTSTVPPTSALLIHQSAYPVTVPPGGEGFNTAQCRNGEQIVGGGYQLAPASAAVTPYYSYPEPANIWAVDVQNNSDAQLSITVYVDCLLDAAHGGADVGTYIVPGGVTTIAEGAHGSSVAECPGGWAVTDGGYAVQSGQMTAFIDESAPAPNGGSWVVNAHTTFQGVQFQSYVLCASKSQSLFEPATYPNVPITVNQSGDQANGTATCPDTFGLTGGGYIQQTDGNVLYTASYPVQTPDNGGSFPAPKGWQVAATNVSQPQTGPVTINIYAVCAKDVLNTASTSNAPA